MPKDVKKMLKQDIKVDTPDLAIDGALGTGAIVEDPSTKKNVLSYHSAIHKLEV